MMKKTLGAMGAAFGVAAAGKAGSRITDVAFDSVQKYLAEHPGAVKNAARAIAAATGTVIVASVKAVAAFIVANAVPLLIGAVIVFMIAGVVVLMLKASNAQTA
ncbi:hypothetical protein ACIQ7Q_29230 [Streptomyces sp. NPDC096176]|uniref:hypothetical protein n=1 Tax=Streptomyces sp. NPDC096176 TaxID=3366079 RepID=UPI003818F6DC